MAITLHVATVASLDEVVDAVAGWQRGGQPVQLHPGDLGWHRRMGSDALAAALRVWRRDGRVLAVGLADGADLVRMALAPDVDRDENVAARLVADLTDPACGVLPGHDGVVEARYGVAFRRLLAEHGWTADEPWTPLRRGLAAPVPDSGLRVEVVGPTQVADRVAVQRAAFPGSTFSAERWHAMAAAPSYRRARCLVGYDARGDAVATATVWSAGTGRPGLLEPLGVHRDHRGRGHGTAITLAAAATLRDLGASSATVCTPAGNVGAVAAYASAGFERLADVTDFRRVAPGAGEPRPAPDGGATRERRT